MTRTKPKTVTKKEELDAPDCEGRESRGIRVFCVLSMTRAPKNIYGEFLFKKFTKRSSLVVREREELKDGDETRRDTSPLILESSFALMVSIRRALDL